MSDRPIRFAAIGLDHAHIFGQIKGLLAQGCELVGTATDDDSASIAQTVRALYPDVPVMTEAELIGDDSIDLIVTAAVPDRRGPIAIAALTAGKNVMADKPGCTTLEQLDEIKKAVADSGKFWSVTFSERFEVPAVTRAGQLVKEGRIGQVVQTLGLGPHREGDRAHLSGGAGRPDWFYDEDRYGGILVDIASHQIDQFLWFTGSETAEVMASQVANYAHPDSPKMNDFGDMILVSDKASGYIRVDWFTPQGLPTWGDGRLILLGTKGYIEMRKYVDIAGKEGTNHLILVDDAGVHYEQCTDVALDYYPNIVADIRNGTTTAAPQEHTFEVMRLAIVAQQQAKRRGSLS